MINGSFYFPRLCTRLEDRAEHAGSAFIPTITGPKVWSKMKLLAHRVDDQPEVS